jgi:hypothetical protein
MRGAAERTVSPRRERHEEAMDVALGVCSNETGGFSSPNLLRFPIDVNRSTRTALGLYDCGASNKFVSKSYIANSTEKIKIRRRGTMKVTTAGHEERIPRKEVRLTICMRATKGEDYVYTGWFTIYPLAKYDIILGMDWMEEVENDVNYRKKRL